MSFKNRSAASIAAQKEYVKTHQKSFTIRLINKSDADVIEKLNSMPNRSAYVKGLIRADIMREKKKNI